MAQRLLSTDCLPGPETSAECPQRNYRRVRALVFVVMILFLMVGVGGLAAFQYRTELLVKDQVVGQARAHAREFEAVRLYVSSFGGVYIPASEEETANPHLVGAVGDLASVDTSLGVLILQNSPLVASRVSSYLRGLTSGESIVLRMASEMPLNKANQADGFERSALASFRANSSLAETWAWQRRGDSHHLRYATPILASAPCVRCHPELSSQVGRPFAVLGVDIDATPVLDRVTETRSWMFAAALGLVLVTVLGVKYVVFSTLGSLRDSQNRLMVLARTDGLTGLVNNRHGRARLGEELRRSEREGSGLAVALLDLDDFKQVNDSLGHVSGDAALQLAAEALTAHARTYDTIARVGGEEFVVIMPGVTAETAVAVTDRMREAADRALREAYPQIANLGASAGVTLARPGETERELVARADQAMYEAKRAGKHRTTFVL